MDLNSECSVVTYYDNSKMDSPLYFWTTAFKAGSVESNIYDNYTSQYDGTDLTLPVTIGKDNPESSGLGQCTSPSTGDILICYNGGNSLYANEKYIYCRMFFNSQNKL